MVGQAQISPLDAAIANLCRGFYERREKNLLNFAQGACSKRYRHERASFLDIESSYFKISIVSI